MPVYLKAETCVVRRRFKFFPFTCALLFLSCTLIAQPSGNTDKLIIKEVVLQLTPGPNNPRNSEGDFVTLKDGRIMFVYSHYTGNSTSDHAPAHLAARYSDDNGKKWTKQDDLIIPNEGGMNVMSVSLLRLQNGNIALFYLRKNSIRDCLPVMRLSTDEAKTWSDPVVCIKDKAGYFVLNNNRVIQLKSGRLLMPVALHTTSNGEWQNKANLFAYYSDDNGKNWQSGNAVPDSTGIVTQEPGVVELENGNILMFIRANGGTQLFSHSNNRGETWTHVETSGIASPLSPASVARIPGSRDLVMIWNNNDGSIPALRNHRTPLSIALSTDNGKTWQNKRNIENDPGGWYCYTAIHFRQKHILLAYLSDSPSEKTRLTTTRISRIKIKRLYKGRRL